MPRKPSVFTPEAAKRRERVLAHYYRNRERLGQERRARYQTNLDEARRKQRDSRARARAEYLASLAPSLTCPRCGFVPEDLCQLQVDHTNGDHHDNRADNLQVLCSNCHDLKTKRAGENNWRRLRSV